MEKPKVIASRVVFRGFLNVTEDLLERSDGARAPYTHISFPGNAVVILAQTPEGKFILNREYRHPTGGYLLGCPGGKLEPGEDPIQGGMRELLEETGYAAERFTQIGVTYHMPANCSQKVYFLKAENGRFCGPQKLDLLEYIRPEIKSLAEIKEEIRSGGLIDSHLLAALGFFHFKDL